jgi:hypothetical protein
MMLKNIIKYDILNNEIRLLKAELSQAEKDLKQTKIELCNLVHKKMEKK